MAFGAFDGVHRGHIHYLKEAKRLGDRLIVAVSPDDSHWHFVHRYNLPASERIELVKELGIADKVIEGSTNDALEKVRAIKPDIIAITSYHHIDVDDLQRTLQRLELSTRVVKVKQFHAGMYDYLYEHNKYENKLGFD